MSTYETASEDLPGTGFILYVKKLFPKIGNEAIFPLRVIARRNEFAAANERRRGNLSVTNNENVWKKIQKFDSNPFPPPLSGAQGLLTCAPPFQCRKGICRGGPTTFIREQTRTSAAHSIYLGGKIKKKMLKYAKRTQFIGLTTVTTGYTNLSDWLRQKMTIINGSLIL